ncbi:hypothetical protein [Kaistia granuli]|uniref:hypothetical protein n=1 Tax=Kaistia granuli TaxID=363259 RepID=UPI000367BD2D|nr:hypothetical protein [Kaistia granuli]
MAALVQAIVFLAFLALLVVVSFGSGYEYQRRQDCTARGGRSIAIDGDFVCAAKIIPIPHTPA